MEKITAQKEEILNALQANRDAHRAIFLEAVEGYRDEVIRQLSEHLERVMSGKRYAIRFMLPEPEDHTREYDRAIRMVQLQVGSTITLSERDVQNYVMDDWSWTAQFLTSNSTYSAAAAASLNGL